MKVSADIISGISVGIEYINNTSEEDDDDEEDFESCIILDLVLIRVLFEF